MPHPSSQFLHGVLSHPGSYLARKSCARVWMILGIGLKNRETEFGPQNFAMLGIRGCFEMFWASATGCPAKMSKCLANVMATYMAASSRIQSRIHTGSNEWIYFIYLIYLICLLYFYDCASPRIILCCLADQTKAAWLSAPRSKAWYNALVRGAPDVGADTVHWKPSKVPHQLPCQCEFQSLKWKLDMDIHRFPTIPNSPKIAMPSCLQSTLVFGIHLDSLTPCIKCRVLVGISPLPWALLILFLQHDIGDSMGESSPAIAWNVSLEVPTPGSSRPKKSVKNW